MNRPSYALARTMAPRVQSHFASRHKSARAEGRGGLAPLPSVKVIEAVIEAGFWASLRREEGRSPTISLAFLPPEQAEETLLFDQRIPLAPRDLIRLAPAVERPGIHLGVWREAEDLYVWGAMRSLPNLCFVLEVIEPGVLVVKYSRGEEHGKFGNAAVLRGDQVDVIDRETAYQPECPGLLASLLGANLSETWLDSSNLLVQLALSMQDHGHGGALLIVPPSVETWQGSIVQPMPYRIRPSYDRLARLVRQDVSPENRYRWKQELERAVDGVAGLTAVDGATILSADYEVLAFGAKIKPAKGAETIEKVMTSEPVAGSPTVVVDSSQIGGTRHLSAAQFARDQQNALALVASQDGRFTIFAWSEANQLVHARRIDTLLL